MQKKSFSKTEKISRALRARTNFSAFRAYFLQIVWETSFEKLLIIYMNLIPPFLSISTFCNQLQFSLPFRISWVFFLSQSAFWNFSMSLITGTKMQNCPKLPRIHAALYIVYCNSNEKRLTARTINIPCVYKLSHVLGEVLPYPHECLSILQGRKKLAYLTLFSTRNCLALR